MTRTIVAFLLLLLAVAPAAAQERSGAEERSLEIYGREWMTPRERDEYRARMWRLRTEAERERFRQEHRRRMDERALERGLLWPEERGLRRSRQEDPAPLRDGLRRLREAEEPPGALRRWSGEGRRSREGAAPPEAPPRLPPGAGRVYEAPTESADP